MGHFVWFNILSFTDIFEYLTNCFDQTLVKEIKNQVNTEIAGGSEEFKELVSKLNSEKRVWGICSDYSNYSIECEIAY